MQINVADPGQQTLFFFTALLLLLILTTRLTKNIPLLNPLTSNHLKGLAVLAVIFAHIGYVLSNNNQFLYPLSSVAGVAVNIFLLLSGFGLTISTLKKRLGIFEFYQKRLLRIFIPMWIVITLYLLLDYFLLQRNYPNDDILKHFLGVFPRADVWANLNSPLWYFTFILFLYLIYPLVTYKKLLYVAPLIIIYFTYQMFRFDFDINEDVIKLYKLHTLAFPIGMILAIVESKFDLLSKISKNIFLRVFLIVLLIGVFIFTYQNSGIGEGFKVEQQMSLIGTLALTILLAITNVRNYLLELFGKYSYEIYLLHWPLMSRYDLIYQYLPPFLGTLVYLVVLVGLGYLLQSLASILNNFSLKSKSESK